MKTTVVVEPGKILVKDIPVPELQRGEALVQVKYAGICGSDIHVYLGHHPTATFPVTLGHELAGQIADIKDCGSAGFQKGDRVVVQPYKSCAACDLCLQGRGHICSNLSVLGVHEAGCFAEYIKVPVNLLHKIPKDIDFPLAALLEPLAVAVHDVRSSNLKVGESAFIIGGGPIGILIALVARLSGAAKIVISEVNEYRLKLARELGFLTINPHDTDIIEKGMGFTEGKGFDVVYEVTGIQQGYDVMTDLARTGGTIVIVGIPHKKIPVNIRDIMMKELSVQGVRLYTRLSFAAAVDILNEGIINEELTQMVDKVFPLEDVAEALKFSMEDKEHTKVLLKM